jgi:hypothetical protein
MVIGKRANPFGVTQLEGYSLGAVSFDGCLSAGVVVSERDAAQSSPSLELTAQGGNFQHDDTCLSTKVRANCT